jgi:cytosine/adenosine deaminase-related metal-dependent hydrolase
MPNDGHGGSQMRIESGTVVANPLLGQILEDSAVTVSEGMIVSVGASDFAPGGEHIDARGCWVLPGLVDAHTHLYSALALGMPITGARARSFPQVLERLWWRLDRALLMEDVRVSGLLGAVAGLSRGVTAVFDHHSSPGCTDGSLDALAQAVNTVGIRASLAYEVSDRDGPHASQAGIAENVRFLKRTRAEDSRQLCGHFGLHSLYTISDGTLRCCVDANRPLGPDLTCTCWSTRGKGRGLKTITEESGLSSSLMTWASPDPIPSPRTVSM